MAVSKEILYDYVLRSLGGSHVEVELAAEDIDIAIVEALEIYNRYNPLRDRESEIIYPGSLKSFPLPDDCYAVVDVEIQNPAQVLEMADPSYFNIFNNFFLIGGGQGAYAPGITGVESYAIFQIWRKLTMKEFSLDPDWYVEEHVQYDENNPTKELKRQIHFYNPTGLGLRVFYVALRPHLLEQVLPRDWDWIRKYTLAHSKEILGMKRRKHKTIPMASQTLQLDGAELVQEGREEKQLLEANMVRRVPLPPPIWG